MQYSSSDSYKKNILLRTRNCTSHLLTLKRRSIAPFQGQQMRSTISYLSKYNSVKKNIKYILTKNEKSNITKHTEKK